MCGHFDPGISHPLPPSLLCLFACNPGEGRSGDDDQLPWKATEPAPCRVVVTRVEMCPPPAFSSLFMPAVHGASSDAFQRCWSSPGQTPEAIRAGTMQCSGSKASKVLCWKGMKKSSMWHCPAFASTVVHTANSYAFWKSWRSNGQHPGNLRDDTMHSSGGKWK